MKSIVPRSYEIRFFKLEEEFPFRDLPVMPTVCLLVAERIDPPYGYTKLVTDLMAAGCGFFMTWGAAASEFEDVLGEIVAMLSIERNGDTFAVSTSHEGDTAEEVAFFMLQVAIPDERPIRCCIGIAGDVTPAREEELRSAIQKIAGN